MCFTFNQGSLQHSRSVETQMLLPNLKLDDLSPLSVLRYTDLSTYGSTNREHPQSEDTSLRGVWSRLLLKTRLCRHQESFRIPLYLCQRNQIGPIRSTTAPASLDGILPSSTPFTSLSSWSKDILPETIEHTVKGIHHIP